MARTPRGAPRWHPGDGQGRAFLRHPPGEGRVAPRKRGLPPPSKFTVMVRWLRLTIEAGCHDPASGSSGVRGRPSSAPSHLTARGEGIDRCRGTPTTRPPGARTCTHRETTIRPSCRRISPDAKKTKSGQNHERGNPILAWYCPVRDGVLKAHVRSMGLGPCPERRLRGRFLARTHGLGLDTRTATAY